MKFSKDYSKLDKPIFTTIRKNTGYYRIKNVYGIHTPTKEFLGRVIITEPLNKNSITEKIAQEDADCSKAELIAMLEKWYGKQFDDFILLTLAKEEI